MANSFYSLEELSEIGFKHIGDNVLISRKCSIYSPEKIYLSSDIRIDDFCILSGNITIGNYVHVAAGCKLFSGKQGIILEDFTGISSNVSIYSVSDDYSGEFMTNPTIPDRFKNVIDKQVIIGKHSIIGTSSVILPGVMIGEGVSCGAMSLINKNLEPWSIYAGIPARKIKARSKKVLELENEFLNSKSDNS